MHVDRETHQHAVELLEPHLTAAIERFAVAQRFSTKRLIDVLLADADGQVAYQAALELVGKDSGDHMSRLVVHGQVIPEILRACGLVHFAGFIHGEPAEDDGFAVPSRWRRV